jgi:hypothetical protein
MKKAFGAGARVLISIRPRSTMVRSGGSSFGCLACGPSRHVRNRKPSATEGNHRVNYIPAFDVPKSFEFSSAA